MGDLLQEDSISEELFKKFCHIAAETGNECFKLDKLKDSHFYDFADELMNESYIYDPYYKDLLDCAKFDLEASKILYGAQIFGLSAYHLQQCMEKLTKSYGLFTGYINRDQLYYKKKSKNGENNFSIQHISPRAFIILLKNKSISKRIKLIYHLKGIELNTEDEVNKMEKLISNEENLQKLSSSQIKDALQWYENIHKKINKVNKREIENKSKNFVKLFLLKIEGLVSQTDFNSMKKSLPNVSFLISKKNFDMPFNFMFLALLSIITFPHFLYTRYPKEKEEQLDYRDYKNLGIMNVFDYLTKVIERRLIKRLEVLYKDV